MGRMFKTFVVLGVVAIVVLAYFAFVGVSEPVDDFGDDDDISKPTDDTTAYAVFHSAGTVQYSGGVLSGVILTLKTRVYDYQSPSGGQVYETKPLWSLPDINTELVGHISAKVTVTGAGYIQVWQSEPLPVVAINGVGGGDWTFDSGRCFFESKGTYQVKMELLGWTTTNPSTVTLDVEIQSFEVLL